MGWLRMSELDLQRIAVLTDGQAAYSGVRRGGAGD